MAIVHARVAQNKDKIGAEKTRRQKRRDGLKLEEDDLRDD
jgi:hypothetical protein